MTCVHCGTFSTPHSDAFWAQILVSSSRSCSQIHQITGIYIYSSGFENIFGDLHSVSLIRINRSKRVGHANSRAADRMPGIGL